MRPNALAAVVLSFVLSAFASSKAPPPLKRIDHPSTLTFEEHAVSPSKRHTRRSSTPTSLPPSRLTVSAFGETYHLHLRPNEQVLHPQARINYYSPSGEIVRTEPLTQYGAGVRVYEGVVIKPESTDRRWKEDSIGGVLAGGSIDRKSEELGWARITASDDGDYEGAFSVRGVGIHHIQKTSKFISHRHPVDPHPDPDADNGHIVIFRDRDRHETETSTSRAHTQSCSHDALSYNTDPALNEVLRPSVSPPPWYDPRLTDLDSYDATNLDARLVKRQSDIGGGANSSNNYINSIGSHVGCPTSQSIMYFGVAADCRYVQFYGGASNATTQILNDFNTATSVYKSTFNISLGIVELAIMDETCPSNATAQTSSTPWNADCQTSITLNDRLSLFSQWRGAKGADGAGLWHLMSGCPTGVDIGTAWLGVLCRTEASGSAGDISSGTGVSTATSTEWQVVSHEIGHNFGAIHDCDTGCTLSSGCCPSSTTVCSDSSKWIMDPVTYAGEDAFSPCSIGNICTSLQTQNTTCLKPADSAVTTISLKMCGNGIVEEGEDCDPGQGVTSSCCDSATCKFTSGALCDPKSSTCCTDSCQFAPSTQICRPAKDAKCDFAEMCTGTSGVCPIDKTQADGVSCGGNGLACASGTCTSNSLQCATVGAAMGLSTACSAPGDKSCQVSCQTPGSSNSCTVLQSPLINGSPCGYGGTCQNSVCKAGSFSALVKSWYKQNLQIAIPVTIAAALVVLMIVWRLIQCCMGASRRKNAMKTAYATGGGPRAGAIKLQSWAGGPPTDQAGQGQQYPPPPGDPYNNYPPNHSAPGGYVYTPPGTSYPPYHTEENDSRNDINQPPPPRDEYENPFEDTHHNGGAEGGQWNNDRQAAGGYSR
ncbi:hypothetical protein FRB94_011321 [Tulasnella sp. JGI-2019a]|nr:hypothetical protein FRB93_003561 [Tulasnella sp. JGI-2019a]KAG8992752.1 hypothetical protein FRB94_011321 [Tulasnella sp. JGI-2019a]KAG9037277.1 hypothetical protein FRB95_006220 [Tulasnella sp. JGI-2019a]